MLLEEVKETRKGSNLLSIREALAKHRAKLSRSKRLTKDIHQNQSLYSKNQIPRWISNVANGPPYSCKVVDLSMFLASLTRKSII